MTTIVNANDVALQATSPRIEAVPLAGTYYIPGTTLINGDSAVTIQANAANAIAQANAANAELASIADDNILAPGEKAAVVLDYNVLIAEKTSLDSQATSFGITTEKTNYDTAVSALTTYLGTLTGWNVIPGSDVTIVGTTFRSKFSDVYAAKQVLLNKLAAIASITATWSGVTGTGKPEDNATYGADYTTTLSSKPTTVGGFSTNFGASSFSGLISGSAGIGISGPAVFSGSSTAGGQTAALIATSSTQIAVAGVGTGAGHYGVYGGSDSSHGVHGQSSSGIGVFGQGSSYGVYSQGNMYCGGTFSISSSSLVANLNANYVGGVAVGNLLASMGTQSGYANVANSNLSIAMAGSLGGSYRFIASGGINIQATDISDERIKKDIQPETLGLSFILDCVEPVTFRMKEGEQILHHGFIAQNMMKHFPIPNVDAFLTQGEDGMYGTGYISLIAPMVKAIKELKQHIDDLKQQLEELKCQDK